MRRALLIVALLVPAACVDDPEPPYYDRVIQPILTQRCTQAAGGSCHVPDEMGRAMGNLDLTSLEGVKRRPDLLRHVGPYPFSQLLLKAAAIPLGDPLRVRVGEVEDVPLFVRHAGGTILRPDEAEFVTLQRWLDNGANRDGLPAVPEPVEAGPCPEQVRTDLFSQPMLDGVDVESDGYKRFQAQVWPVLEEKCTGRVCHGVRDSNGVPTVELYFTCGDTDPQRRFNYLMARTYTTTDGRSPLAEKALAGVEYHAPGPSFDSDDDPEYRAIRDWAAMDAPFPLQESEGEAFFRANVQPTLVARGCYFEACHSLVAFNTYRPLAGTAGSFGTRALLHNYLMARFQLGLESRDPFEGRLIKKNLLPAQRGIVHRGGSLLAPIAPCELDPVAVRADPTRRWFDEADAACILATWHRLERAIAVENGQLGGSPGEVGVFVRRPPNPDRLIDFDSYRPGADLMRMDLVLDGNGRVTGLAGSPTSLLGGCGVAITDADVRRPDINPDGTEVVFAMRAGPGEGLDLWRVGTDGSDCRRLGLAGGVDQLGTPVHHLDPAYGPGGILIWASTAADTNHPDPAARGYPSRTPKWFLPNSNVWIQAPGGIPVRLSYLSGAELTPRLLHTREVIYAIEKAAPDFYQISTRAIRMDDGSGYRPQLGQRPTMGYGQVIEMRELIDFRTVAVASDPGSWFAGGTLVVQDIALGLEELAFEADGFFHPTRILDARAAARPGEVGEGLYRSPTPLPDGRVLTAYSPGVVDVGDPSSQVDYGLWIVDPTGVAAPFLLWDTPGQFDIEPVVAYSRIFVPQPARVHQGNPTRGEIIFHSLPLFAPLLNGNSRLGTQPNEQVVKVRVLEQLSPPPDARTPADVPESDLHGPERVYVKRRLIGEAPLLGDGSVRLLLPVKTPLILELVDAAGNVLDRQREEEQVGPGETQPRLVPVVMFNAVCGGCHNARDGSELNVTLGPDVITKASTLSEAAQREAVDLYVDPAARPEVPVE